MVRKTGPNNHNNAGESGLPRRDGRWQTGQAAVDGAGAAEVVVIYKSPARFPYGNWEEGMRGDGGRSGRDVASWAKVRLFLRE